MSYLDRLRLHFAGRFQASVSTVNNFITYYNNKTFEPKFHMRATARLPGPGEEARGLWNPYGDGAFRLLGCKVTSAFYADGSAAPADDPILELLIADSDRKAPAKMVDLDPQQQLVSMLYGLEIRIADQNGDTRLRGQVEPAAVDDLWQRIKDEGVIGDAALSGAYQSVLRDLEWGDVSRSSFLQQLKAAAKEGLLSIKINADRYQSDWSQKDFLTGRLVGTIGPASADEPSHFVVGRQLLAKFTPGTLLPESRINNCVAVLDKAARKVRIDLGNSMPATRHGDAHDIGALCLAYAGPPDVAGRQPFLGLGGIDYLKKDWYETTAGVVELPADRELTQGEIEALKKGPIALLTQQSSGAQAAAITEPPGGLHVSADMFVFRLTLNGTASVRLYATAYGEPMPEARILCFLDSTRFQTAPDQPPVGTPAGGIEFEARVVTDEQGRATLTLLGGDPKNARGYIDGQLYGIRYALEQTITPFNKYPFVPSDVISVLVHDEFVPDEPLCWFGTEKGSLQPIFQQYANLYPVMLRFFDMGSYDDVCRHKDKLIFAFSLDLSDPNSMPVTRDLSPSRRSAILRWLCDVGTDGKPRLGVKPPADEPARGALTPAASKDAASPAEPRAQSSLNLSGKPAVWKALQAAILLEHTTIPAYLYALYSLKPGPRGAPGPNSAIAATLQAIIKEEMLHMTLACNLLNALGGHPVIDDPAFLPKYPARLPGSVAAGLEIGLEPFSLDLVSRVFMVIEKMEETLDAPRPSPGEAEESKTIGRFYTEIRDQIRALGDSAFTGDPGRQVTDVFNGLKPVTDAATACEAIEVVILQGEGTPGFSMDIEDQTSHYHRLAEIWNGKRLIKSPDAGPEAPLDQRYVYSGDPIHFDPSGVFEAPSNPTPELYAPGSPARRAVDNFNYTYTTLLKTLHGMFNGQPELYSRLFGVMMSMRQQATDMMSGTNLPGPVGPTFHYQPVNPSLL